MVIINGQSLSSTLRLRRKKMLNFVYGSALTVTVMAMVNIIDSNVPNDLMYWIDLYMPF